MLADYDWQIPTAVGEAHQVAYDTKGERFDDQPSLRSKIAADDTIPNTPCAKR